MYTHAGWNMAAEAPAIFPVPASEYEAEKWRPSKEKLEWFSMRNWWVKGLFFMHNWNFMFELYEI